MAYVPRVWGVGASLFFAAFFLRAAYLSWFRWSPLAIRHLVGDVFFFITVSSFLGARNLMPPLGALWYFVALPVCYTTYRVIANLLSRRAFSTSSRQPAPFTDFSDHGNSHNALSLHRDG